MRTKKSKKEQEPKKRTPPRAAGTTPAVKKRAGPSQRVYILQSFLDSLGLKDGRVFGYWLDFVDDEYHQIVVNEIVETDRDASYPRAAARTGANPPQHGGGR